MSATAVIDRPAPPAERSGTPRSPRRPAVLAWLSAHPRLQQLPARPPVLILAGAMIGWFVLFAGPVIARQDHFGTFDHDLGIWDQYVWLLAQGKSSAFLTVRGLTPFGFHASPAMALYVPFYWLGAGPNFLNLSMLVAVCAGAVPVFRAAHHHLRNEWQALVLALAFLVNYAGQWMVQETFHPEVIAIVPLLFAYLAAIQGRWRAYALWIVFALMWKEDIALAGLMLGLVLAIRGRRTITGRVGPLLTRRAGLYTMLGCAVWFVVATQLIIPHFSSAGAFTEGLYGDLGASPTEMVRTAVTDPSVVREHLELSNPQAYLHDLSASFGFTALLSPLVLLIGLPQALINLLAVYNFFWTTKVHYAAMPLLATALASIEGVARWRRPGVRRFLLGAVAIGAFFTCISWGISPLSAGYRTGVWPLDPDPQQSQFESAIALLGPDDAVSANYRIVPHLTHRDEAYTFPSPWIPQNWGVKDENRPHPNRVDWIIVDPSVLSDPDQGTLVSALTEPGRALVPGEQRPPPPNRDFAAVADPTQWRIVVNRPGLLVAQRVRP